MSIYEDTIRAALQMLEKDLSRTPQDKIEICSTLTDLINDARDKFIAFDEAEMELSFKRSDRVA